MPLTVKYSVLLFIAGRATCLSVSFGTYGLLSTSLAWLMDQVVDERKLVKPILIAPSDGLSCTVFTALFKPSPRRQSPLKLLCWLL